jgi:hypothetical protein
MSKASAAAAFYQALGYAIDDPISRAGACHKI